jgi:hypothetical protein
MYYILLKEKLKRNNSKLCSTNDKKQSQCSMDGCWTVFEWPMDYKDSGKNTPEGAGGQHGKVL